MTHVKYLLPVIIALQGCVSLQKDDIYVGISPEGRKMYESVVTTSHRGFFTPSVKTISAYRCEMHRMWGLNSPKTGYPVCVKQEQRVAASQSGMSNSVVTTAIAGAAAYYAAGAIRPNEYNHSESTSLSNDQVQGQEYEGSIEGGNQNFEGYYEGSVEGGDVNVRAQGGKGGNSHSRSYSSNYNRNTNTNRNTMQNGMMMPMGHMD